MKKEVFIFIKKVLLLILPFLIILGFIELQLRKIPNSYAKKRQFFENSLGRINVLVLGSSQSLYDINPDYFNYIGFNLSDVNQSLYYDAEITLKFIDRMPSLKCVVLSVSYFSLWYQISDDEE
ncbi:MAG TPA: hypothetical protein VHI78_11965, partial [Bacteroidales bacterium]|nr:hypothetical protein [Bacteroidales bacterium]